MSDDTWEDAERLFHERHVEYRDGSPSVPTALASFAIDELGACDLRFDQADVGLFFLVDQSKQNLIVIGATGASGSAVAGQTLCMNNSPLGGVVSRLESLRVGGATGLFVPIADEESCVGVLGLMSRSADVFSDADVAQLERKGRLVCREVKALLSRPEVSHWYHVVCEALQPESYSEDDVKVLLDIFGVKMTTRSAALADVLTADVGEAARGLGAKLKGRAVGGANRYSPDELRTVLKAFGVEITAGSGRLTDILTTDIRQLLRKPAKSG